MKLRISQGLRRSIKLITSLGRLTKINIRLSMKEMKQVLSVQTLRPLKRRDYYEPLHSHKFVSWEEIDGFLENYKLLTPIWNTGVFTTTNMK